MLLDAYRHVSFDDNMFRPARGDIDKTDLETAL